ncbi:transglutaminase domain-containing protein [Adlercreutzia equolifaciens]
MRKTFRKIVSGVMAVLLMQLSLPATSFGEESAPQVVQAVGAGTDGAEQEGSVVEAASLAGDDVVTVTARAHSVDPDGWSATVTYEKPQAGVSTEFTITADGGPKGSGSYQYQQGFIYKYDPYIWIYDPTFPPAETFRDSNVLSYQFVGAGRYQYQFVVRDTETARYMRFSFEVEVAGDGFIDANEKAREIVAECLPDGNVDDYETALALHDWIIDNVSYDHTFRNLSVDRALLGMAVTCEGYHAAYVKLLETAGMETGRVEGGGHVWTAVKMDGKWYHVDTTHDDVKDSLAGADIPGFLSKEQQAHLLFGLDDATMKLANAGYHGPTAGFEADSLENSYFIKTGDIAEWSDPIAIQILGKLNQKETSFTLTPTNASWAQDSYRNVVSNLVAYELNQAEWTTDNQQADAIVRIDYADNRFAVNTFTVLTSAPTVVRNLIYNGASQAGLAVPSAGSYALSGTTKAIDAGTYTATVAPGAGYAWDKLGDKTARSYQWTIAPASIASGAVSVSGAKASYEHTGSPIRPNVTVTHNGHTLKAGTDYQVSYGENTQVGKATVTIRGAGKNYSGSRTISFDITNPRNAWRTVGGKTYYYGADGQPVKWEQKIGGHWYYFNGSGVMQTGWVTWSKLGTKSYFDADGRARTGWHTIGGKRYYFDPATARSVRWENRIGGSWYYFNAASEMQTGWVTWSKLGTKSYFNDDGKARTGWHTLWGKRYYFDPATARSLRWENRIGGSWYYFNSASEMQTGWVTWSKLGTKSYFNDDGKARTGWHTLWGKRYYFDPATARSLRWENRIGGSFYYFNAASQMHTGWLTWSADKKRSYFDVNGKALTGWQTIGGQRYYFDPATYKTDGAVAQSVTGSKAVVYWVVDGEVYHTTKDCVSLKRSTNIKSGTVAQSGKKRVCKNCG